MIISRGKLYLYKAFIILPFTFLFAPIFYPLLNYRPNPELAFINLAFPLIIYFWYAIFIYFSMALALVLKKYKYIAYPIIIASAFFSRFAAMLPSLDLHMAYMFADEFRELYYIYMPVGADELAYFMFILFITSAVAGCFSAAYTKKTALDFLKRGNTFLFLHISVLGGLFHGSIIYLVLFAASYFMARNFILINRELEIYGAKGAYNTSGVNRIILYYFSVTLALAIAPLIISLIVMPVIISGVAALADLIFRAGVNLILDYERNLPDISAAELPVVGEAELMLERVRGQLDELLVYNILLALALLLLIIFRKAIWRMLKELSAMIKTKISLPEAGANKIINFEIISELPKPKIKKGKAAYKNYIKKSRGITEADARFLFIYSCLHLEIIKRDDLKSSLTPSELAAQHNNLADVKDVYEDLKYGQLECGDELISDVTEQAERILKQVLI